MLFSVEGTPNRENISIRASDLCLILFELTLMHKHNESTVFKTLHGQVVRDWKDVGGLWPSFVISNLKLDINAKS